MSDPDVLIIGAGHNGLTCAAYLAMAGLRVKVVERRKVVGGAAVTEEFHPGFRNSVAAYTVSLLNPQISADLRLAAHGLGAPNKASSATPGSGARMNASPTRNACTPAVRIRVTSACTRIPDSVTSRRPGGTPPIRSSVA